jgi:hypothetical protein
MLAHLQLLSLIPNNAAPLTHLPKTSWPNISKFVFNLPCMLKRTLTTFISLFCFASLAQTPLRFEQLAPKGLPHYPTDIHVFPDQSAIVNVAEPYFFRFKLFNDSSLKALNYTVVQTNDSVKGARIEVLSNLVFTKGKYITKDGGNTWKLIKSTDFLAFWFLKPDFWVFQNQQGVIFTSKDSASTWLTDNELYLNILGDEDYLSLIRKSDSTIFHLYPDRLEEKVKWPNRYPNWKLPLYYHRVDSLRYLFEVDLQMYLYNLSLDTTYADSSINIVRPFINVYTPDDQFIREDNLSYVVLFADTSMQWINRNKVYNAGSFEYSDNRMWYNSYKPFHHFSLGNIASYRPLGNRKTLLGNSDSGFITFVSNTNKDGLYYSPQHSIDSDGESSIQHNNEYTPYNQMEYGLGIAKKDLEYFQTRNYGLNWQKRTNFPNVNPPFWHYAYNRAVDTNCLIDIYLGGIFPYPAAKINLVDGSNSNLSVLTSNSNNSEYLTQVNDIGFKNCDTGSVIINQRLYRTKDNGISYDQPFSGIEFYNFKREGSQFYLSSDTGIFTSNNYYDWQLTGGPNFKENLIYVLNDSSFFGGGASLKYSFDNGQSLGSLQLGVFGINSIANISDTALLVASQVGALYKVYLPWANIVNREEDALQLPNISLYPNPNHSGIIYIDSDLELNYFKIWNVSGQLIEEGFLRSKQKSFGLDKPKPGIYQVEIGTDSGFSYTSKIVFE